MVEVMSEKECPETDSGWSGDPATWPREPDDWEPQAVCREGWFGGSELDPWLTELPVDPWSAGDLDRSEIGVWRGRLLSGSLPGGEAALIELLRGLEDLKSAAAAVQAQVAVAFEKARRRAEADAGVARSKRGAGVGAEVALARRESPHRGGRLLGLARALVEELPHTLQALGEGTLNEWRATLVARETACLDVADRQAADAWLGGHLANHPAVGDKRLVAEVRRKVIELDQRAVVRRCAQAAGERRVTLRPLPDGMIQLTAILPLRQGVAVYAALRKAATEAAGVPTSCRDADPGSAIPPAARMADTLVERVTGRAAEDPCQLELMVVITDQALLGAADTPAHVDGYGPMPASWVQQLIGATQDTDQQAAISRLFRGPGRTVQLETSRRVMSPTLRKLIAIRDQQCRTPWCGAPIRHVDHVQPHAGGGPTSLANGQGLCEACNYAKAAPGWRSTPRQDSKRGHIVTLSTPTGHSYESTQPTGPSD